MIWEYVPKHNVQVLLSKFFMADHFFTESWENFIQCRPGDIHENPCCRCGNNRWICNGQLMCKARPQKCSPELQVEIPGQCCKGCLQKQQSTLGVQKYTTSSQGVEQDDSRFKVY